MKKNEEKTKILKSRYVPTAEFYSQIIDSLQDYSILTLDNEFIINSWSSGAEKIFGYKTEEIIGEHFDIIFTDEDKKSGVPKVEIDTSLKEGRAIDNRWHICKDGSKFYAYGLVFPLKGLKGEMLGYVKILRDLTLRRKQEEAIKKYVKELEELNNHKENILAIVSHDLRSPLSGIIGAAKYLSANFEKMPNNEVKEMLDLLYKSSKDELNTLDYLVEWARIKYATEVFSPKEIKLTDYVQKVFETLSDNAQLKNVSLHNEIDENEGVFADGKMLISVLQNIVSNAIKHSKPDGKITISAIKKEDKIIVEIKDNGVGMSKEIKEKLFTPQMNVLASAREKDKGAGIGLLLVKGFLEKNDGEIWVESTEGVGSSFYFTLPIEEPLDKIVSADKIEFDESA
jgi:two-component system CheB/CheR fusion protein